MSNKFKIIAKCIHITKMYTEKFWEVKQYSYEVPEHLVLDLKIGDFVYCENQGGISPLKITEFGFTETKEVHSQILSKVDNQQTIDYIEAVSCLHYIFPEYDISLNKTKMTVGCTTVKIKSALNASFDLLERLGDKADVEEYSMDRLKENLEEVRQRLTDYIS